LFFCLFCSLILPPTAKEIEQQKEAERIVAEKADSKRANQRERNRKFRAKITDEQRLVNNAKRRAEYAAKKQKSQSA